MSRLIVKLQQLPHDEKGNKGKQGAADGPVEESAKIPSAEEQGTSEVFFQHGAQDEAQHERRSLQPQTHEQIATEAKDGGNVDIIQAVVDAVSSDAAEKQDRWKQYIEGDLEHRQPVAHQRHVEDE